MLKTHLTLLETCFTMLAEEKARGGSAKGHEVAKEEKEMALMELMQARLKLEESTSSMLQEENDMFAGRGRFNEGLA
jgi:hypothetical protein